MRMNKQTYIHISMSVILCYAAVQNIHNNSIWHWQNVKIYSHRKTIQSTGGYSQVQYTNVVQHYNENHFNRLWEVRFLLQFPNGTKKHWDIAIVSTFNIKITHYDTCAL